MKPRYLHDCSNCSFLGAYENYDLYVCARHGKIDTLIARYGNDGGEYASGLDFALAYNEGRFPYSQNCKALSVALTLAERRMEI